MTVSGLGLFPQAGTWEEGLPWGPVERRPRSSHWWRCHASPNLWLPGIPADGHSVSLPEAPFCHGAKGAPPDSRAESVRGGGSPVRTKVPCGSHGALLTIPNRARYGVSSPEVSTGDFPPAWVGGVLCPSQALAPNQPVKSIPEPSADL